jgi:hypothetical protein
MTPQDWAAIVAVAATVVGGVGAMVRMMVKNYLSELKPNSGSSMNDRLSRVEAMLEVLIKSQ